MTATNHRLKEITLTIGGTAYACQVTSWELQDNTPEGDKVFTFCDDGEFREETDDDYALNLKWVSDWTASGLNRYLEANRGTTATFVLTNNPDNTGAYAVRWTGTIKLLTPNAGGDVRTTEMSEMTFPVIGRPVVTYP